MIELDDDLNQYWLAPSEPDTDLGMEWTDKPHRLIYDLVRLCQEARDEAHELRELALRMSA